MYFGISSDSFEEGKSTLYIFHNSFWYSAFGLNCTSEYFQCELYNILGDMEGVEFHIDDVLIHAETVEKHKIIRTF